MENKKYCFSFLGDRIFLPGTKTIEGCPWKSEIKQMMEFFKEAIKEKQRIYFE